MFSVNRPLNFFLANLPFFCPLPFVAQIIFGLLHFVGTTHVLWRELSLTFVLVVTALLFTFLSGGQRLKLCSDYLGKQSGEGQVLTSITLMDIL